MINLLKLATTETEYAGENSGGGDVPIEGYYLVEPITGDDS